MHLITKLQRENFQRENALEIFSFKCLLYWWAQSAEWRVPGHVVRALGIKTQREAPDLLLPCLGVTPPLWFLPSRQVIKSPTCYIALLGVANLFYLKSDLFVFPYLKVCKSFIKKKCLEYFLRHRKKRWHVKDTGILMWEVSELNWKAQ